MKYIYYLKTKFGFIMKSAYIFDHSFSLTSSLFPATPDKQDSIIIMKLLHYVTTW